MTRIVHFSKIGLAYLLILFAFSSFINLSNRNESLRPLVDIIIIKGIEADGKTLDLRNLSGNSVRNYTAQKKQVIIWVVKPELHINCIKITRKNSTDPELFSEFPAPVGCCLVWRGTITGSPRISQEEYNITWTDANNVEHVDDPKIQVLLLSKGQ